MSEDDKPVYRGFDELARKLFPELELGASEDNSGAQVADVVEELRRMRVDASHYPGTRRHHYDGAWDWPEEMVGLAREVGDALFQTRVTERWPAEPHPELIAKVEQCRQILHDILPTLQFEVTQPAIFEFRVAPDDFPKLPPGYAFKGGVARKALARALRLNVNLAGVRDMDIVYLGQKRNLEFEQQLIHSYLQDDWVYAKKSPIEMQPNCKAYFKTREFAVNQVILRGPAVMCTAICLCDFITGTIRPTHNHMNRHDGKVDSIVAAKAVRFYVEGLAENRPMRLDRNVPRIRRPIKHFHLAIHLARAMEKGEAIGLAFLNECISRRLTRLRYNGTLDDAIERLRKAAQVDDAFFPPLSPPDAT